MKQFECPNCANEIDYVEIVLRAGANVKIDRLGRVSGRPYDKEQEVEVRCPYCSNDIKEHISPPKKMSMHDTARRVLEAIADKINKETGGGGGAFGGSPADVKEAQEAKEKEDAQRGKTGNKAMGGGGPLGKGDPQKYEALPPGRWVCAQDKAENKRCYLSWEGRVAPARCPACGSKMVKQS